MFESGLKRADRLARMVLDETTLEHSRRVRDRVEKEARGAMYIHATVALLHDVIEDSAVTAEDLAVFIGEDVARIVEILTRRSEETYANYIQRIAESRDQIAIDVKLADLRDHMELMDDEHRSLEKRYLKALAVLETLA